MQPVELLYPALSRARRTSNHSPCNSHGTRWHCYHREHNGKYNLYTRFIHSSHSCRIPFSTPAIWAKGIELDDFLWALRWRWFLTISFLRPKSCQVLSLGLGKPHKNDWTRIFAGRICFLLPANPAHLLSQCQSPWEGPAGSCLMTWQACCFALLVKKPGFFSFLWRQWDERNP